MERTVFPLPFNVSVIVHSSGSAIKGSTLLEGRLKEEGNGEIIKILKGYVETLKLDTGDFSLDTSALTAFQKAVYSEILKIPPGETVTYGELAERLSTSPRAVGQALRRNPIPLFIPCHRVVSRNGIGGFSSGAVIKEKLLDFERKAWFSGTEGKPESSLQMP